MYISSAANPLLKDIRRAVRRGALTDDGYWVAENFHLLEEALRSGCEIKTVLAAESAQGKVAGLRITSAPDELFNRVAGTSATQGVIALVRPPVWTVEQALGDLTVVMDGIQEPGNAGAIVRAAEAFGATGVVFLRGTVSPHNPKTLRASAGSLFRLPFASGIDPAQIGAAFEQRNLIAYAAVPSTSLVASTSDLTRPCAFIIGNEGRGVSPEMRACAREITIPTTAVESLNAAVAAGILLYEARRQRA